MSKPSAAVSLLALVALVALLLASSPVDAQGGGVTPTVLVPCPCLETATPGAVETPLPWPTWISSPAPLRTATPTPAARVYMPMIEKGG